MGRLSRRPLAILILALAVVAVWHMPFALMFFVPLKAAPDIHQVMAQPASRTLYSDLPRPIWARGSLSTLACAGLGGAIAALLSYRRSFPNQRAPRLVGRRSIVLAERSVSALVAKYTNEIDGIRAKAGDLLGDDQDDVSVLRLVLEHKSDIAAAVENLEEIAGWRQGAGRHICEIASRAVEQSTAKGSWDNDIVFAAAPHSQVLRKYYTPSQYVVLNMLSGDLCCCIRASAVEAKSMMDEIGHDELLEFFLYAREVNNIVANMRSCKTGQLCQLVSVNDFTGVSGLPDKRFQEVLGDMSKQASRLWPGLAGPTIMLNLPGLVRFIVGILTPLFPGSVQARIKFAKKRLEYLDDLSDVLREPMRSNFLSDLQGILAE